MLQKSLSGRKIVCYRESSQQLNYIHLNKLPTKLKIYIGVYITQPHNAKADGNNDGRKVVGAGEGN
jgi:hypothetical protein